MSNANFEELPRETIDRDRYLYQSAPSNFVGHTRLVQRLARGTMTTQHSLSSSCVNDSRVVDMSQKNQFEPRALLPTRPTPYVSAMRALGTRIVVICVAVAAFVGLTAAASTASASADTTTTTVPSGTTGSPGGTQQSIGLTINPTANPASPSGGTPGSSATRYPTSSGNSSVGGVYGTNGSASSVLVSKSAAPNQIPRTGGSALVVVAAGIGMVFLRSSRLVSQRRRWSHR